MAEENKKEAEVKRSVGDPQTELRVGTYMYGVATHQNDCGTKTDRGLTLHLRRAEISVIISISDIPGVHHHDGFK